MMNRKRFWSVVSLAVLSGAVVVSGAEPTPQQLDFFERKIRPVLIEHCYECHSTAADELDGKLAVDTAEGLLLGGETGPAVVPKNPKESLLISALEYRDLEMPPDGKLPEEVLRDFRRWINMGAPDPRRADSPSTLDSVTADAREGLWSLQPVHPSEPPAVSDPDWSGTDVDRFIKSRLEIAGLAPGPLAPPHELLRRLSFDLTGLPPSPEEVAAFEHDHSPAALTALVDRLLASEQFGERWGRHWLDAVRYAESAGSSRDVLMPHAWRYRDYVLDAMNNDLPYDRFLKEQLAGDLLPAETSAERDRLTVATGLLAIGSKSLNGGNLELDVVDDQIDVIGKAILGLTISCARCHDHKFDPIPTADYYALAGIFRSTETLYGGNVNRPKSAAEALAVYLPLGEGASEAAEIIRQHDRQVAQLTKRKGAVTKQIEKLKKDLPSKKAKAQPDAAGKTESSAPADTKPTEDQQVEEMPDAETPDAVAALESAQQLLQSIEQELKVARKASLPTLEYAVGVREQRTITDSPIQLRGEKGKNGDVVPRGFLRCVTLPDEWPPLPAGQSGRLELAEWLTHPQHPLTARVAVNRIWQHLFGRGLVETVDNFGVNGLPPSHPELLDSLAHRFVHGHGWSTKKLIRELVLTRTYRLSSGYAAAAIEIDPAGELRWRMNRRRLEAEAIRDAMLTASGALNRERPPASAVARIGEGEVGRGINTDELDEPFEYRSVYLPIIRGLVPEVLRVFDFPEPSNPQGLRDVTNVPTQSLYLLNSPFVIEQSERFAERVRAARVDDAERIRLAYLIALGRAATPEEVERSRSLLSEVHAGMETAETADAEAASWAALCQALFASAEFRYID